MSIQKRIEQLRQLMKKHQIDMYYIPTSDNHQSEYVAEHFKARQFMSGFTGSAGTLIVTQTEACLWTDGRYFIQAERQLQGSNIILQRMGQENVLTVKQYIEKNLQPQQVLGFNGDVVAYRFIQDLQQVIKPLIIKSDLDLVQEIWVDRPEISSEKCFLLADEYAGETTIHKIERVRTAMKEKNSDVLILSKLEDIAWLLNIRGRDIKHTPVVLAYAIVFQDEVRVYLDLNKLGKNIQLKFAQENIQALPYEQIKTDVLNLVNYRVWVDSTILNTSIYQAINCVELIDQTNPLGLFRALKNEIEIRNLKLAHVKDGVALTKFIYWLKTNVAQQEITELSAMAKLEQLRAENSSFIEPSFNTIAGYKANAAMMHYSASLESNASISADGMLLVDSGGQYYEGTTDVTRTIVLGELSKQHQLYFTTVVRSMIRLAKANFLAGLGGCNLDILARQPIWDLDLDYQCGTGHGVGYLLGVHEGPHNLRYAKTATGGERVAFEEGMIVTDEPGIYLLDDVGIRIENELLVCKKTKNFYGQFMGFETITLAPIDLAGIDPKLMLQDEIDFLNDYHQKVFQALAPYLTSTEKKWLQHETRKISK